MKKKCNTKKSCIIYIKISVLGMFQQIFGFFSIKSFNKQRFTVIEIPFATLIKTYPVSSYRIMIPTFDYNIAGTICDPRS